MDSFFHPRQRISIQDYAGEIFLFLHESDALGLALRWIWVSAKFKTMVFTVFFNSRYHFLETTNRGSKNPIVVTITKNPMEVVVNPTSSLFLSKNGEKSVNVKTVEDSGQNLALPNAVVDTEDGGKQSIPFDMGKLKLVYDDHESDKDLGETGLKNLQEEEGMTNKVEGLSHISLASKDIRSISQEVTNGINDSPGTESCRHITLIGKL